MNECTVSDFSTAGVAWQQTYLKPSSIVLKKSVKVNDTVIALLTIGGSEFTVESKRINPNTRQRPKFTYLLTVLDMYGQEKYNKAEDEASIVLWEIFKFSGPY